MNSTHISIDLHEGWWCLLDCRKTLHGRYSGVAEITYRGQPAGTLVIVSQPDFATALARTKLCGRQFVKARSRR